MIRNLSKWLDDHSRELDSFNDDVILAATDSATHKHDLKNYIQNIKNQSADDYKVFVKDCESSGYKGNEIESFEAWFKDRHDIMERDFNENRVPDDYYPIWNTLWEFPSSLYDYELNGKDINGLVFFEVDSITYVGLTTCGMDMTPSIYTAYMLYSDLRISKRFIVDKIYRDPKWFTYVIGDNSFKMLIEALGVTDKKIEKAIKVLALNMESFNDGLASLTKLRDSKKTDQFTTGLLALMQFNKSQEEHREAVSKI